MTLQRLIALLAVGLALAVLGYLLWVTQRNPVDLNLHTARIEQLKSADRADRVLQQQIVRARLNVQGEARGLDEARQALADAYTAVNARSGGLRGLAPEVDAALGIYGRHMTRKLELLEDYAQVLQEYAARFAVLQADGENALRVATESGRGALREQLLALIEEAAAYAIQFSSTDAQRLNELIAQVDRSQQGLRSDIEREAVIRLLSTVAAVRNARDALQTLKTQLDELPTIQALQRLSAEYIAHFDRQTATARRDRRILAVYATALLLAFALIAVRLRRSFSELDQMNAELQRANTSLEQQVEERTQDLKKALEDLRMQQAQLIQSEKMASLGQMVAGVAHEINTPLGYARANVETVRETLPALGAADPESVGELDMLLEDAQHGLTQIGELVMSLKDFSRLDRSHTELLDVHDGLETALKICHNQLKARIEIEREYGELPRIHGAPSQLNQVFLNLLTNAAQAIDGPGTIRIRTRREGDQVEIGIRDSGCGIDAETQAHIFEPFFTTKPVGQGTGLGLSIVYRIIEDHRGTIRCESAPGEGAEFIITLPIRRAARPEAEDSDEPVAVAAGSV